MVEGQRRFPETEVFKQRKVRKRLSDEEAGNLLAALNSGAKIMTLSAMREGIIYDRSNLRAQILNAQAEPKGWELGSRTLFDYCSHSLSPIGLVTKEVLNPDLSTWGYQKTDYGGNYGDPLGGLLTDYSRKIDIPLNDFLGKTGSPSPDRVIQTEEGEAQFRKRAPIMTLRILRAIVNSPSLPIRETDVAREIGEYYTDSIGVHLKRLSKLGLIQYQRIESNTPIAYYRLSPNIPEGELPLYRNSRKLTKVVFDLVKEYAKEYPKNYLTSRSIYDLLPQKQKEKHKERVLVKSISHILYFLNKKKYVDLYKFNMDKKSEINITEDQRAILAEFLDIMDRFQNRDHAILQRGKRLAKRIITDPHRVSAILRRAKETSRYASPSPTRKTREIITSVVSSNSELGIDNRGIKRRLEEYGIILELPSVQDLTLSLVRNGSMKKIRKGSVYTFFPNSS